MVFALQGAPGPDGPVAPNADATDEQLVALWLHGRALLTIRAYRREAARFLAFVGKPVRAPSDVYLFAGRKKNLNPSQASRIVLAAAQRAKP